MPIIHTFIKQSIAAQSGFFIDETTSFPLPPGEGRVGELPHLNPLPVGEEANVKDERPRCR
jgi:hypothetical protein